MTLKVQILQTLRRLFIILVGLTMTWFSEKMLIFNICRRGLMPNLIKKSWTVSSLHTYIRKYMKPENWSRKQCAPFTRYNLVFLWNKTAYYRWLKLYFLALHIFRFYLPIWKINMGGVFLHFFRFNMLLFMLPNICMFWGKSQQHL